MSMRNMLGSRKGTTLVEILVTMVVLFVGILTVIQMFPTGFGVIRYAESTTIATKLAQAELERWKATSVNLPTGIVPIDANGNVLNDQRPDTYPVFDDRGTIVSWRAGFQTTIEHPNGELDGPDNTKYTRANVLNIRKIIGETTRIPVGTYFQTAGGTQYGARYALAFGPIDVTRDEETQKLVGLEIRSADLKRRIGSREYYPPSLKLGEYAIDYGEQGVPTFYVAFPRDLSSSERLYYVSYSFWAVNNDTHESMLISVLDQEIPPAEADDEYMARLRGGDWVAVDVPVTEYVPNGYTFDQVEDGTDSCARGFVEVGGAGWSDNPYEFALADNILGVISFNPIGRGMYEYTAQGVKPIKASINYRILDPRIIREDKVVPQLELGASSIPIKMALRFILDGGDPTDLADGDPTDNPNEPVYNGMAPAAGLPESVLVIDLSTGMRVDLTGATIDYKAGIVSLPPSAHLLKWVWDETNHRGSTVPIEPAVNLEGRQLRFFYRADGDWTIQCQKAYSTYARQSGAEKVDYCHYEIGGSSDQPRLYFAPCEAEKTVSVDYTYATSDGVEHKVVGESQKISDFADNATNLHFIDLNLPNECVLKRVYAVVGTSFRVRVIWRDSKAWRHVDLDTNLTRGN